jgi:hypothetical protein
MALAGFSSNDEFIFVTREVEKGQPEISTAGKGKPPSARYVVDVSKLWTKAQVQT